jgi:hypothetical protein
VYSLRIVTRLGMSRTKKNETRASDQWLSRSPGTPEMSPATPASTVATAKASRMSVYPWLKRMAAA